ncbi:hypothetical protein B0H14DRAFT_2398057, partial [Mycena olivaceomarginata]
LMASLYRWSDPKGMQLSPQLFKTRIPQWQDSFCPAQLKLFVRILDGEDIFYSMATGDGKSALFVMPIIVFKELALHSELYPDLPVRLKALRLILYCTFHFVLLDSYQFGSITSIIVAS